MRSASGTGSNESCPWTQSWQNRRRRRTHEITTDGIHRRDLLCRPCALGASDRRSPREPRLDQAVSAVQADRQHLLGRQLRLVDLPGHFAARPFPHQHRRGRHGPADPGERRAAGIQDGRRQDPHLHARPLGSRGRDGRTEEDDRRRAGRLGAGQGIAGVRREGGFSLRQRRARGSSR